MKLILAVSANGFLAAGKSDSMTWTGKLDKYVFRILTNVGGVMVTSRTTGYTMPKLKDRRLLTVSKSDPSYPSLDEVALSFPDAWLIGGPTLAMEALESNLIDEAFMCHSSTGISAMNNFPTPTPQQMADPDLLKDPDPMLPDLITPRLKGDAHWNQVSETNFSHPSHTSVRVVTWRRTYVPGE